MSRMEETKKRKFHGFGEEELMIGTKRQKLDLSIYDKLIQDDDNDFPCIKEEIPEFVECFQNHEPSSIDSFHLVGFYNKCSCALFDMALNAEEAQLAVHSVEIARKHKIDGLFNCLRPEFILTDSAIRREHQVELKFDTIVQLSVAKKPVSGHVLFGLIHDHPELVESPIFHRKGAKKTPFVAWATSSITTYVPVHIEHIGIVHCAIVHLNDVNVVNFNFSLLSTDPENNGVCQIGRQWKLLVLPIDEKKLEMSCIQLSQHDMYFRRFINVQVVKEARKNRILKKKAFRQEFKYPGESSEEKRSSPILEGLFQAVKETVTEEVLIMFLKNLLTTADLVQSHIQHQL